MRISDWSSDVCSSDLTKFTDFLEGSGGKIITVLSLAGGLIGLASGRFSLGQVAVPVGVCIGVGTGVPIVTSVVTAVVSTADPVTAGRRPNASQAPRTPTPRRSRAPRLLARRAPPRTRLPSPHTIPTHT